LTGQYWIVVFYYVWAAFIQETIEHNKNIDIPYFTSGRWHLIHHTQSNKNYGLFFPIWDLLFNSYKKVT
jgi:sterol desaturase/sphingolipid hydroxylase (fatty acid hydroxylase superfamily)